MDPLVLRLIQMLLATLLGGVVMVLGIVVLLRGVSGKSNLLLEGGGVKAKLVNGSPGLVLTLIGAAVVAWSLSSGGTEHVVTKTEQPPSDQNLLDKWLLNARRLNGQETYLEVLQTVFDGDSFRDDHIITDHDTTLSGVADQVYHDPKYWLIISAVNKDRGYYSYTSATGDTRLSKGTFVEIIVPAKFVPVVKTYDQFIQVAGVDVQSANDDLLAIATNGTPFSQSVLDNFEKAVKAKYNFGVAYQFPTDKDSYTLTELSLKYYRGKKYWPIIVWVNGLKTRNPSATVPLDGRIEIPIIVPNG